MRSIYEFSGRCRGVIAHFCTSIVFPLADGKRWVNGGVGDRTGVDEGRRVVSLFGGDRQSKMPQSFDAQTSNVLSFSTPPRVCVCVCVCVQALITFFSLLCICVGFFFG